MSKQVSYKVTNDNNAINDDKDIRTLVKEYVRTVTGAYSSNSTRALLSDFELFDVWCTNRDLVTVPSNDETVTQYVKHVTGRYKPATLRRHLSSIGHIHRALGHEDPTKTHNVTLALRRADRIMGTRQKQARGITEDDVETIFNTLGSSLIDIRDRAVLLTARDLMARRSEIVELQVNDVDFQKDGTAIAQIRRSKTDPTGNGSTQWLSSDAADALSHWIMSSGIKSGPMFRSVRKGGRIGGALSPDDVSRRYKNMASRAGIDPVDISGHSTRVGMAQDLCASGMELTELMVAGRWKSPKMPAKYAENLNAARGAVAKYHRKINGRLAD